eukprot:scaffold116147_cov17-Tisochrysis_lutea.AAC.1
MPFWLMVDAVFAGHLPGAGAARWSLPLPQGYPPARTITTTGHTACSTAGPNPTSTSMPPSPLRKFTLPHRKSWSQ